MYLLYNNPMPNKKIISCAAIHAVLTALYVAAVAFLMSHGETLFGKMPKGTLTSMGFLLLFVVSAAITGALVFGKPVLWYLDGKKREAVRLALFTILFLAVIVFAIFLRLILTNKGV